MLWVVAGALAGLSLASGTLKLVRPAERLGYAWAQDFAARTVKVIGTLEILGATGLILPGVLGIFPVLVPLAAVGLASLMAGALITHLRRHEIQQLVLPTILLALAVFVAWGRFGPYAFAG